MNIDSTFVIPPQVIARKIGDETVILALETGTYFGLDPVGARMWHLIEAGKSLAEVCDTMIEEYDVERNVLERDLLGLIGDLVEKRLVDAG
jgi:Coenzyme PQQ synthesis protein D (PqqD)